MGKIGWSLRSLAALQPRLNAAISRATALTSTVDAEKEVESGQIPRRR
jgi:hypothetical protein